jgi:SNF2 family DNA or RNA helicase
MAVDPGGGKTISTLDLAHIQNKKLLVVCPSYLILTWEAEIKKFYGDTKKVDMVRWPKDVYGLWDTDIALTTYETLKHCEILFSWAEIVAFDEATYLKTMTSKRSEAAHRFVYENSIERVILMSGTPIKNRVEEYYSLLALCNYRPGNKSNFLEKYPDSITFADHFSHRIEYDIPTPRGSFRVIKWTGVKNVEELKSHLKGIYIRVEDTEFSKTEPIIFKEIICDNKDMPELLSAYQDFESEHEESLAGQAKMKSAILTVPHTIKYVKDLLEENDKVVIYTDHREPCKMLAEAFGVTPIMGGMNSLVVEAIKNKFQTGDSRVIVATIGSFSMGVTLTASNNLVVNDPNWTPGDMRQVYKRIDRMSQTKRCFIHLMVNSLQSGKIYEAIQQKQKVIDLIK